MHRTFAVRGDFESFDKVQILDWRAFFAYASSGSGEGVVLYDRRLFAHLHRQPVALTIVDTVRRSDLRALQLVSVAMPASFCSCIRSARLVGVVSCPGVLS
jgi:hypothetical protein